MKWTKRLKWLRLSKVIIPIALAISLVFAGFTVYAHEAENFVVRIKKDDGVQLSLTLNRDLTEQTSNLVVPVDGTYDNVTFKPTPSLLYDSDKYYANIPDDIAKQDGVHSVYLSEGKIAFYSFSFYLVNNSSSVIDVDYGLYIDSMTTGYNKTDKHIDDAVRIMFIEDEPLLSDETYTVYKKAEKTAANEAAVSALPYAGSTVEFLNDDCIFKREGLFGLTDFKEGDVKRFTLVIWLEGEDPECKDEILPESLKLSMSFEGHA